MKEYKITLIGLFLAVTVFVITFANEIDLFEAVIESLGAFEEYEIDEFIIPALILIVFALFDQIRRRKQQAIEIEKIKIYKAMLSSTHHILNNFLNQMQLFKLTAEKADDFDPEILSLYDDVIRDAATQIDALGSVANIDAISIRESVAPK